MKDKLVSFILTFVLIAIIIAVGILGYIIYKEIPFDEIVFMDFQGIRKSFNRRRY